VSTTREQHNRVHPSLGAPKVSVEDKIAVSEATHAISSPRARRLRARAKQLRRDASNRLAPLADALRRRAAELELQAFVIDHSSLHPALIPVRTSSR
jgi:hypothetical protein